MIDFVVILHVSVAFICLLFAIKAYDNEEGLWVAFFGSCIALNVGTAIWVLGTT